ncbi:hypothetical protein WMY93_007815 [Mugilogobius chulae]|uniref:Uncharacterized protein n=1 Tax=Mugilogobius chulae TaxID=88201 RepID=A0AAW0PPS5_9GOBI
MCTFCGSVGLGGGRVHGELGFRTRGGAPQKQTGNSGSALTHSSRQRRGESRYPCAASASSVSFIHTGARSRRTLSTSHYVGSVSLSSFDTGLHTFQ